MRSIHHSTLTEGRQTQGIRSDTSYSDDSANTEVISCTP